MASHVRIPVPRRARARSGGFWAVQGLTPLAPQSLAAPGHERRRDIRPSDASDVKPSFLVAQYLFLLPIHAHAYHNSDGLYARCRKSTAYS